MSGAFYARRAIDFAKVAQTLSTGATPDESWIVTGSEAKTNGGYLLKMCAKQSRTSRTRKSIARQKESRFILYNVASYFGVAYD